MKKRLLLFCSLITLLHLTACDLIKEKEPDTTAIAKVSLSEDLANKDPMTDKVKSRIFSDFIYEVGPRFNHIKKTDLDQVRSFSDLIGSEHAERIVSYTSLNVIILEGEEPTYNQEMSKGGDLTARQIQLLQSAEYSTNLVIRADYMEKNAATGQVEESYWSPYLTVVPEKQAVYKGGENALKQFLKDQTEAVRAQVDPEKLQPAKLYFIVTKEGTIEHVKLDRPSGYPEVDEKMIQLIGETQNAWQPAEDANGKKVDQELVVSFGLLGC
ncbi:MAG: hypothetical protein AAFP76_09510 [Bacteroidota bacterium]